LNRAARALAGKLLSHGEREPHKDDITKLVGNFPHGSAYWSTLERDFATWLADLGPESLQRMDATKRDWLKKVELAARDAWALTARAAGDDALALRAIFASEGLLLAYLAKQRKEAA
jgi:CRISPR system Cascade subunit CasA